MNDSNMFGLKKGDCFSINLRIEDVEKSNQFLSSLFYDKERIKERGVSCSSINNYVAISTDHVLEALSDCYRSIEQEKARLTALSNITEIDK